MSKPAKAQKATTKKTFTNVAFLPSKALKAVASCCTVQDLARLRAAAK
jgi:hypothetical protein